MDKEKFRRDILTLKNAKRREQIAEAKKGEDDAAAKVNSRRTLYRQAGNSIPVTIFESIFKQII